jgi:CubicO group peptidase (beta-lactamase class C family)
MSGHGGTCSSYAPGHALHLIQARLAAATPSDWVDAIVEQVDAVTGDVVLRAIDDGSIVAVWNAEGAAAALSAGAPVALHGRYGVLAVGSRRFNVVPVS